MPDVLRVEFRASAIAEPAAVAAGLVVFALCAHQGFPWLLAGGAGFALAAGALARSLARTAHPAEALGLGCISRGTVLFAAAGCFLGLLLGILHRAGLGLAPLPAAAPRMFAAVACLIGASEELVYRGWLQGRLRPFGWPFAIVTAACAHAAYKTALFVWPPVPGDVDLAALAGWTFAGGILFGLLRESSRSLLPPLLAHAVFDLVTYGALVHPPWWVWS